MPPACRRFSSPDVILKVHLYGTATLLEEFGAVIASSGAGVVISSQSGDRLPVLTLEEDKALATTPPTKLGSLGKAGARHTGHTQISFDDRQ